MAKVLELTTKNFKDTIEKNDFVIIDRRSNKIEINDNLIQKLSDRRTGAGCDQLITINNPSSDNADVSIDIFNPSGDKAEACGNGTRCVAKILFDENNKKEIELKVNKTVELWHTKTYHYKSKRMRFFSLIICSSEF